MSAHTSMKALAPCPFCGAQPLARWTGANPKAQCKTEGCFGTKLPVINLDVPEQIAAWNTRAALAPQAQVAEPGTECVVLKAGDYGWRYAVGEAAKLLRDIDRNGGLCAGGEQYPNGLNCHDVAQRLDGILSTPTESQGAAEDFAREQTPSSRFKVQIRPKTSSATFGESFCFYFDTQQAANAFVERYNKGCLYQADAPVPVEPMQAVSGEQAWEFDEDEVRPSFIRWHTECGRRWSDDEFVAFIGGAEWGFRAHLTRMAAAPQVESEAVAWFLNSAAEGAPPHYSQVAAEYIGTPGTFPLYAAPQASTAEAPAEKASLLAQDVKNMLCIDGHLNRALDNIMATNEPDAVFAYLGELARKAVDLSFIAMKPAIRFEGIDDTLEQFRERIAPQAEQVGPVTGAAPAIFTPWDSLPWKPKAIGFARRADVELYAKVFTIAPIDDEHQVAIFTRDQLQRAVSAVLATPPAGVAPPAPPAGWLPHPGSPEASAMMDSVLAEYNHPSNPKNCARAGYVAAQRMLVGPGAATTSAGGDK